MFSAWKEEKATAALVGEVEALSDRLASAKPHVRDSLAAHAQFWAARYLADGVVLHGMLTWSAADAARFVRASQTRIAALRKARDYDLADGLTLWLYGARAVAEPRLLPPLREVWSQVADAGPNAATELQDLLAAAALPDPTPDTAIDRLPDGLMV